MSIPGAGTTLSTPELLEFLRRLRSQDADAMSWYLRQVDRDLLADQLRHHQVAGLCFALLDELSTRASVDRGLLSGLKRDYLEQWAATEKALLQLRDLQDLFEEWDVPFLLLKGPYLSDRFYGDVALRRFGDLDVLIRRRFFDRAEELLRSGGYRRRTRLLLGARAALRFVHDVTFVGDGMPVEVHHALRLHPSFAFSEDRIWADSTVFQLDGRSIRVLSDEFALTLQLLSLHNDLGLGTADLRSLLDLYLTLNKCQPEGSWDDFFAARKSEATLRIAVNTLAFGIVAMQCEPEFPELVDALLARRDLLVAEPFREVMLLFMEGASVRATREWAFRQYESSVARTLAWRAGGAPILLAAYPDSYFKSLMPSSAAEEGTGADPGWTPEEVTLWALGVHDRPMEDATLRIGSLTARLHVDAGTHRVALEKLFRLSAGPVARAVHSERPEVEIRIFDTDLRNVRRFSYPNGALVRRRLERIFEIHHDVVTAIVLESSRPLQVYIAAVDREMNHERYLHALMVVFNRLLLHLERLHLHSAAVDLGDGANLFLGDNGAGKSTISLRLAQAGGRILGEDHVVVRRTASGFVVSGCDSIMRLSAKTEQFLLDEPVPVKPRLFAGVEKKQFEINDVLEASVPFEDRPARRLFFPRIGERFEIASLHRQTAVKRLLSTASIRHRLADTTDEMGFVEFLSGFLRSVEVYDLTLSKDLSDLDELVGFLQASPVPSVP